MSSPVQNLVISLAAMQLARRIPFENPEVLNYVRIGYACTQLVILGVYYYITMQVKKKNDQTVLKYVEPASPMSPDQEPKLVTTTVRDYDLSEVSKLLRSVYIGIAMMAFLHGYMNFTQPLFIQSLMGLKGLYDAKPVTIHVLGQKAEGDLKRPWKAGGGMFGATPGPQTDNAAIAEAEKKIGSKKED
ncbi:inorganic phosphate transport PHO88 [Dendrothele bispora CBS 962.96]|uniref:Inorganic phosphate transport PHO88 n=1 Tax=Dendrothele bispora (strain CBS 962.96) TaxID=1314807 RepID=A0A4V4HIW0_DENBC|nr:inorganic phosphate transport PHO88 [Dendrothele bispora CBS 962.96]THV08096.1 inorganic phosphate transport PHO88 [Dendrothele bispora CBS 962.96]